VPALQRATFLHRLLAPMRALREKTGRPHWFLLDDANELLPASSAGGSPTMAAAENTLYVTGDPTALAPAILAGVDGVAACGDNAGAMLEALAAAVSWSGPALPARAPHEGEALVWYRRSERPVELVDLAHARPDVAAPATGAEKNAEVGQVLRRA
jgi:hypothetical protein